MQASDISKIILQMQGRMPESSRALLAHKFIQAIGRGLQERDPDALKKWTDSGGPLQFMDACDLSSGLPSVHHEIAIHDSDLATFCNRWMNVEKYRDPSDGEWKPITTEMNQIRYTIVKELEAMAMADDGEDEDEDDD